MPELTLPSPELRRQQPRGGGFGGEQLCPLDHLDRLPMRQLKGLRHEVFGLLSGRHDVLNQLDLDDIEPMPHAGEEFETGHGVHAPHSRYEHVFAQLRLQDFRNVFVPAPMRPYDAAVVPARRVRLALPTDVESGGRMLARAFNDDPMVTWMLHGTAHHQHHPNDTDGRSLAGFFRPSLEIGRGRGHTYVTEFDGHLHGVAVWAPPDATVFDERTGALLGAAMMEHLGPSPVERISTLGALCRERRPNGVPHFYLFLVGVDPRGAGWGAPLLAPVLDRCDLDGLGAYLESSNARNHAFYRRLGFDIVWQARPADDGPLMTGMWRDPE